MVPADEKEKRDMLTYLLWKTGRLSNQSIGSLLGIIYSIVGKTVSKLAVSMREDKSLRARYDRPYSQFKV